MFTANRVIPFVVLAIAILGFLAGITLGVEHFKIAQLLGADAPMTAGILAGWLFTGAVGAVLWKVLGQQVSKRIFLFLTLNILVVMSMSLVVHLFHADQYLSAHGLDYPRLAGFCLIWGMVGSFISLLLSRWQAKVFLNVRVLDNELAMSSDEQWLVRTVQRIADKAGLPNMPEVGIWQDEDLNAFATGPSKSRSLVAVSSGLLERMSKDEIEAVIGHEVAHIVNGDMVTMTLLQGSINAFVMFASRVVGYLVQSVLKTSEKWPLYLCQTLFQWVLMIFGAMLLCWFSRQREFRADAGGADLAGRENMIAALATIDAEMKRLSVDESKPTTNSSVRPAHHATAPQAALMISSPPRWTRLFSTHPSVEDRIARLSN